MADGGKVVYKIVGDNSQFEKDTNESRNIAGKVASGIGKAFVTAFAVAAAGAVTLGSAVIKNYGEYEQLAGGVETLFKESSKTVMGYADNAYKTAQISANEYMSTVTSFSASLLQSLGGDTNAAAEYANQAVIDMADNANKMGSSMESIQNAYQGFAKQNYTMLDNLKLGYGGTKEEMQRLLEDAEKLTGKKFDISNFADITEAIHVIQQEMGIAGTSAEEASETIQGSINTLKSAFTNLLTGLGDPKADIEELTQNVVDAFGKVVDNITPVLENIVAVLPTVLTAIIEAIGGMLPELIAAAFELFGKVLDALVGLLPQLIPVVVESIKTVIQAITKNIPAIIKAVGNLLKEIARALPGMIKELVASFKDTFPQIIQAIIDMMNGIIEALPDIIQALVDAIPTIVQTLNDALVTSLPQVIQGIITLVLSIVEALPDIIQALLDALPDIIKTIITVMLENLPLLIMGAIQLVIALVKAIPEIILALIEAVPEIITAIVEGFAEGLDKFIEVAGELMGGFLEGIGKGLTDVINAIGDWFSGLWTSFTGWLSQTWTNIVDWLASVVNGIGDWFSNLWSSFTGWLGGIWTTISNWFSGLWNSLVNIGSNIINGIWDGLKSAWESVKRWFSNAWDDLVGGVKSFLGIASPSKLFRDQIGKMIPEGIAVGIEVAEDEPLNALSKLTRKLSLNGIEGDFALTGADMSLAASTLIQIEVPLSLDGREVARATAWYTSEQQAWQEM